jgi:glycosyltransferase involved in cell wall biosynthesis
VVIPVAFDLRDPLRSGIARVARSLARSFAEQSRGRFRLTLAGPRDQLAELEASAWPDVTQVVHWDAERYSARAEVTWPHVRNVAGASIWYFPHWDVPWLFSPGKFVVTVHDLAHLKLDFSRAKRALARSWIRRTTSRARRIITVSDYTRRELEGRWPELNQKIDVIPNGADDRFFRSAPSLPSDISKKLPGNASVMLSVGNLKSYKNLIMGVEVLARLPELWWVVVGEWFPDWRAVEARAIELGVTSRMVVLGRQSDDVLHALYHRASCLFFPSLHEGFGLPIVEALASGTPVVAGDAPGTIETLGDAGIVCRGNSADAYVLGVTDAIATRNSGVERRRERAREFSWSRGAERLIRIVEQVHANA